VDPPPTADPFAARDPIEEVNRAVFFVNRGFERALFDPLTRLYGFVVPDFGKRAIRNVFDNLNSPAVLVNDLLQLHPGRAASTTARFVINSTVGVVGIWDPATRLGIEDHDANFSQTLTKACVPPGPYLILPLLGPTTPREVLGGAVDLVLQPHTWLLGTAPLLTFETGEGITARERHLDSIDALREGSVDYYAAIRSAYLLNLDARDRPEAEPGSIGPDPLGVGPDPLSEP
jgi:phospholipid-binding lipoprotein MlaA